MLHTWMNYECTYRNVEKHNTIHIYIIWMNRLFCMSQNDHKYGRFMQDVKTYYSHPTHHVIFFETCLNKSTWNVLNKCAPKHVWTWICIWNVVKLTTQDKPMRSSKNVLVFELVTCSQAIHIWDTQKSKNND